MTNLKIVFAVILWLSASGARAQGLVVATEQGNLYRVNPETCEVNQFASPNFAFFDITYLPDGRLLTIAGGAAIREFIPATGSLSYVGSIPGGGFNSPIYGMTSDHRGLVYLAGANGNIFTFDSNTGVSDSLGNCGYPCSGDLTFRDGKLLMTSPVGRIIAINTEDVASSTVYEEYNLLEKSPGFTTVVNSCEDQTTYLGTIISTGAIYKIDNETGLPDLICTVGEPINGSAHRYEYVASAPMRSVEVSAFDISCENPRGRLEVAVDGGVGQLMYRLNDGPFQPSPVFDNLPPGDYSVYVEDEFGCSLEAEAGIAELEAVPQITNVQVWSDSCGLSEGAVLLEAEGGALPYTYILNDSIYQYDSLLTGLSAGAYTIEVVDQTGCGIDQEVTIAGRPKLEISAEGLACGPGKSELSIELTRGVPGNVRYSIDGGSWQSNPSFEELDPGVFLAIAEDELGCRDSVTVVIEDKAAIALTLEALQICGPENSSLQVSASNGQAPFRYFLNGRPQASPLFEGLADGYFAVEAQDSLGCWSDLLTLEIPATEALQAVAEIDFAAQCGVPNAAVSLKATGGTPPYSYQLSGAEQSSPQFAGLPPGPADFIVEDEQGCRYEGAFTVPDKCQVYVPSAFSPNGDGQNDRFALYSGIPFQVVHYRIYTYWGSIVYEATNFSSTQTERFWDGSLGLQPLNTGVFVYQIEVVKASGERETFTGELTLLR